MSTPLLPFHHEREEVHVSDHGQAAQLRQLAERLGVTRARVHQLIEFYDVKTERAPYGRLLLVPASEAKKIPRKRPNGVHVG